MGILRRTSALGLGIAALAPVNVASPCGGMSLIDPPSLELGAGPSDVGIPLPEHDCRLLLTNVTTAASPAGETCGIGLQTVDSVIDELSGVVVLANTSEPAAYFSVFLANLTTVAQLNDPANPTGAPQSTGQTWLAATGLTSSTVPDGQAVSLLLLVSTPLPCSQLPEALDGLNAVAIGVTSAAGEFNDPTHFSTSEGLPVIGPSVPLLGGLALLTLTASLVLTGVRRGLWLHEV